MGPKVRLWWGDDLFWGWKTHKIERPNVLGRRDPSLEDENPQLLSHHRSLFPFSGPPSSSWPSPLPLALGDLCCYIFLSSVHHPPTLVSHQCLSSNARPIGHSFWRSVGCCGSHRTVQESHPHQWGQGVNCGYLIRRWQLLLGLLLCHAPMASHRAWNLFCDPREDCLGRRGAFLSCDFGLPRTWSSSAVQSRGLDSLHSSSGTSSSSAWALGLISNGPESPDPLAPQYVTHLHFNKIKSTNNFTNFNVFGNYYPIFFIFTRHQPPPPKKRFFHLYVI